MHSLTVVAALLLGIGAGSPVEAQVSSETENLGMVSSTPGSVAALEPSPTLENIGPAGAPSDGSSEVKVSGGPGDTRTDYPLVGAAAWLVAGAAGLLFPLFLFALPALTLVWLGPLAPVAFLVALAVAGFTTVVGGAVAWLVSTLFSNVTSGFLAPVLTSGAVGVGATFIGGVLASVVILSGLTLGWLSGPTPNWTAKPADWRLPTRGSFLPIVVGTSVIAFGLWGTGVLVAAIGGPMAAAYMYQVNGTLKE